MRDLFPIQFEYEPPSQEWIAGLRRGDTCVRLEEGDRLQLARSYFRAGVEGTDSSVYLRAGVFSALVRVIQALPPEFGIVVFDAYRSRATQAGLFADYTRQIAAKNPRWSAEELAAETRKYVAHPDEPSRFEVPPHLSGGAVDLGLTFRGEWVEMGTSFDDLTERAATDYFERAYDPVIGWSSAEWEAIRQHRRLLFSVMKNAGFTNWPHEWWHFDLGNCVWAQVLGVPWVYGEMVCEDSGTFPKS